MVSKNKASGYGKPHVHSDPCLWSREFCPHTARLWPPDNAHLDRPGPGEHNRIAGTAAEQFARAQRPREPSIVTAFMRHRASLRAVLLSILADDIIEMAIAVAQEVATNDE